MTQALLQVASLGLMRQHNLLFEPISFCLSPGELLCIQGDNGIGKTSLLRVLATLNTADKGELLWRTTPIAQSTYPDELTYIAHRTGLKMGLTVIENLRMVLHLQRQVDDISTALLETLALYTLRDRLARHLSAGQKRRLALARLWLTNKKLWVLDEPFTSLDQQFSAVLKRKMNAHLDQGGVIIMSTHQASDRVDLPVSQTIRLNKYAESTRAFV